MNAIGPAPTAFPLSWPPDKPRTAWHKREADPFRLTLHEARLSLMRELRLAGITGTVISSNAALRKDGQIAGTQGRIDDPGVAVYGDRRGLGLIFANDKYGNVAANVRAIAKTIDAMRGIERWGTTEMVDAAFRGFAALPAGTGAAGWWEELKVAPDASKDDIAAAYRQMAKFYHPDNPVTGDPERFRAVHEAYEQSKGRWNEHLVRAR